MIGPLPHWQDLQRVQTILSRLTNVYEGGSIIVMVEMDKCIVVPLGME
jgi:hypothetical protein